MTIPSYLEIQIRERARDCCEYCRIHEADNYIWHEVDHVISRKHRGTTESSNLCFECNRYKGSDIASIDLETDTLTSLFNPRKIGY